VSQARLLGRLFLMMLLEYAVWGAWAAVGGEYFSGLLFSLLPSTALAAEEHRR
jgi:hypothetical protein